MWALSLPPSARGALLYYYCSRRWEHARETIKGGLDKYIAKKWRHPPAQVSVCVWVRLLAVFQWERKGVLEAFCRAGGRAAAASACSRHEKESARRGALKWLKTPTPALSLARPKCAVYYIALCLFTRCSLFLILRRRARSPWRSRAEFIYCARVKTAAPYSHTAHGGAASPSFELQEAFWDARNLWCWCCLVKWKRVET